MSLIDVGSEDDLLIDSQLDRASFNLRLSIAFDSSVNKTPNPQDEFKSRQSLAWDNAFFTSAGILDLRELSLVNEGFKNPEDQRSKICENRRLPCKLVSGKGEASESFLDFRVSGKHNLQSSKHNAREPKTNISLASQSRMKYGQVHPQMKNANPQTSRSSELSSAQKQDRHPRPPKAQTRSSSHVALAAKSPRSAISKKASSAYTGIASANAGKKWLSKSLDFKGDSWKNVGSGLDVNGIDSPLKFGLKDRNVAQVSTEINGKRLHHENNHSVGGNKAQMQSSMKQNGAKSKRSLSLLPGDILNSSKKASRPCTQSQIFRFSEVDNYATQSAKRAPLVSPEPRGRINVKDSGSNGGLKTNSVSLTKKTCPLDKDDEKENIFGVQKKRFHGGLDKEKCLEITNLFDGLTMEPKGGMKRMKTPNYRRLGAAPPLRQKAKQENRVLTVVECRNDAFNSEQVLSSLLFKASSRDADQE